MFKRLRVPSGELIAPQYTESGDALDRIVRPAILVHSGPGGSRTTLASSDGDITFDERRIKNVIANHNRMVESMINQYGGRDKTPVGAYAPILDQHNDDSNDRIRGRLTGLLRFEKRNVPKVGKNVACAVADITFLGNDTVSKVKNGLIYHLSVGIDEASDTLGEVSCVIEPAAPGAMLLKKKKQLKGATVSKVKLARLKKLNEELKELSAKAEGQQKLARLAKAKANVTASFTKLMADKKLTPAEFKKVDFARLAKLDQESLDSILHVYDARESLVKPGQLGSTSASNFSDVGVKSSEDKEVQRFKLAAKKSLEKQGLKFKKLEAADDHKELEAEENDSKKELALEDKPFAADAVDKADEIEVQKNEEIMQQVEENAAQIARVASMVDAIIEDLTGASDEADTEEDVKDDTSDLEKEDDDDKDEKELSADDKKDDDKKDLSKDDKEEKGDKE